MIDIVLADDQYEVRTALKCILEDQVDFHLASEVTTAADLLANLQVGCPDLILLDWELPGMKAIDLLARAREVCPEFKLIALSVRPEACAEARAAGVHGFVSKGDPPERLLGEVRRLLTVAS